MTVSHLSASIMCGRLGYLADEARRLSEAGVDSVHVDVMDGHFVPNLTFGPDVIAAINEAVDLPLHAHLMVSRPSDYVDSCAQAGTDVFLFHIEAEPYPIRLLERVTQTGMIPGIAINPATPIDFLRSVRAPFLIVMTVEPGFAGQRWVDSALDRIREARELVGEDVVIGVDGNVNKENAVRAQRAGAGLFVCGTSSVFRAGAAYVDGVTELRSALSGPPPAAPE
jgi:ribulose-phosphate 3-epimerase